MAALLVRIIYSVYAVFNPKNSAASLDGNAGIKYLIGPYLLMEVLALVLMLAIGLHNISSKEFSQTKGASIDERNLMRSSV